MRESLVVDGRQYNELSKASQTASARKSEHNSRSHWPLPARDPPGSTCFCGMIIAYTGRAHHPPTRLAQATHLALFTCQCRRRCARKAAGHAPSNAATTLCVQYADSIGSRTRRPRRGHAALRLAMARAMRLPRAESPWTTMSQGSTHNTGSTLPQRRRWRRSREYLFGCARAARSVGVRVSDVMAKEEENKLYYVHATHESSRLGPRTS